MKPKIEDVMFLLNKIKEDSLTVGDWVHIPTSSLGDFVIGKILEIYNGTIKCDLMLPGNQSPSIGIYTISNHNISEPSLNTWINYAKLHGEWNGQ